MEPDTFVALVAKLTEQLAGKPLDAELERELNQKIPPDSEEYRELVDACHRAIAAGWMCNREAGGIRYGRVIKPTSRTHGFSVDVVDMSDIVGPHHSHPNGEIDLIVPLTPDARFDGQGAGWRVYEPDSSHAPTVTGGRALVVYLLPQGSMVFTPAE